MRQAYVFDSGDESVILPVLQCSLCGILAWHVCFRIVTLSLLVAPQFTQFEPAAFPTSHSQRQTSCVTNLGFSRASLFFHGLVKA